MLYRREGYPEEEELVLCTVTNVQHHSVFVKIDEYEKSGMIHISEVSPGRIRNLRDFVQEGKKIVCKVLRIDPAKGHIDLSLRRVNEGQRRQKLDQLKQEQRAENIIESYAKKAGKDFNKVYDEISAAVFKKYVYIYEAFDDIIEDKLDLEKLGLDKEIVKGFSDIIKEKIKPQIVEIKGRFTIVSYEAEGVELIKSALKKAEGKDIEIKYIGGGIYNISVKAEDYKEAEKIMEHAANSVIKFMGKHNGVCEFKRAEG